jgi:hypothetical protein
MGDDGALANERTGNVIVEATYAVGDAGVLIGTGLRWVLVADPGDDEVVEQVWQALTHSSGDSLAVTQDVLSILERAFSGEPPGLAMVDFSPGDSSSTSRGSGHVDVSGPARVLRLGEAAQSRPRRRLLGGVVSANQVELRPVASPRATTPVVAASTTPPPAAGEGLIDGIPESILAAKGPDGPPPRRRTVPDRSSDPSDTGSLLDTTEPDPALSLRIEEGGHTTIRPPVGTLPAISDDLADPAADPVDDHDGATVHRPAHLTHEEVPTVLAVMCPLGHASPPSAPSCRTCHQRVAPQEPQRIVRPVLGGLRLPSGEVVPLDRGVVLGRKPAPVDGSTDWPHLVHLPSDHSFVSRMHLQIELDGWDVLARDLGSRGGTALLAPGREPERMKGGESYVLAPGTELDLADVYAVRFEVGPGVVR